MVGWKYKWYVLYTRSQHEKQLSRDFGRLGIESFLPVIPSVRLWSDRKKIVDVPIFPNYIFVRASCREYTSILDHKSVIGFVKTGNEPTEVPGKTIEIIKIALKEKLSMSGFQEKPRKGQQVVIMRGPFAGFEGKVVDSNGKYFLTVELEQINKCLIININTDSVTIPDELPRPCSIIS